MLEFDIRESSADQKRWKKLADRSHISVCNGTETIEQQLMVGALKAIVAELIDKFIWTMCMRTWG